MLCLHGHLYLNENNRNLKNYVDSPASEDFSRVTDYRKMIKISVEV